MKKNLSNPLSQDVLEIVGLSNKPLSSREIEIKLYERKYRSNSIPDKNKRNSQIYPKLKELSGIAYHKIDLISYYDFIKNLNNGNYKLKLLKKIARMVNIDSIVKKIARIVNIDSKSKRNKRDNNTNYEINKRIILQNYFDNISNKRFLIIDIVEKSKYLFDNAIISIDLNINEVNLYVNEIDGISNYSVKGILREDNPDNFVISFMEKNVNPPLLDFSLKDSKQDKINKIQKNKKLVIDVKEIKEKGLEITSAEVFTQDEWKNKLSDNENINEIQNNTSNFKYNLNLRGFLHYLLHTKSPAKVEKIIQNLLNNNRIKDQFYFVNHSKAIDSLIDGKKNKIKILIQIAKEVESMLDYSSILELKQESTKRYFSKIDRIISLSLFPGFPMGFIDKEEYNKWNEYKAIILKSRIEYEKNMLSKLNDELNLIESQIKH